MAAIGKNKTVMDVSIIIVNYHTKELIRNCIRSIMEHTAAAISYEIIVVDNNTEDLTDLAIAENIRTLQLESNIGFGRANNAGAAIARGELLFFLNPDTLLLNDALSILLDAMKSNEKIGICGANLFDATLGPMHSHYYCTLTFRHALRSALTSADKLYGIARQHNFSRKPKDVEYITGADLMIRADLFKRVGGFHEHIFMYYEDVDLCYRVRRTGYRCVNVPSARIMHLEGQSFASSEADNKAIRARKEAMTIESMAHFCRSNHSRLRSGAIIGLNIFICTAKGFCFRVVGKNNEGVSDQKIFFRKLKHTLKK